MTAAGIKIPSRIVLLCFIFLFLISIPLQMKGGNHTPIPFLSVLTPASAGAFFSIFLQDHPPPLGLSAIPPAIKPSAALPGSQPVLDFLIGIPKNQIL